MKPLYCADSPHHYFQLKPILDALNIDWIMCVTALKPTKEIIKNNPMNNIVVENRETLSLKEVSNIPVDNILLPSGEIIKTENYDKKFDYIVCSTYYRKVLKLLLKKSNLGFLIKTPHSTLGDMFDITTMSSYRKKTVGVFPTAWIDRMKLDCHSANCIQLPFLPIVLPLYSEIKAEVVPNKVGVVLNWWQDKTSVLSLLEPIAEKIGEQLHFRLHPHPSVNTDSRKAYIEKKYPFLKVYKASSKEYDLDIFLDSCEHLIGGTTSAFSDAIIRARYHKQEKGFWRLPCGVELNVKRYYDFNVTEKETPRFLDSMVKEKEEIIEYFRNFFFEDAYHNYMVCAETKHSKNYLSTVSEFENRRQFFTDSGYNWESGLNNFKRKLK